jgi:8-oxo-dGTP pyrophosphatase MutT (NUDIX family)
MRRRFAVLVPLAETAGGLELLFEVRSPRLRQPGEVCFPGGRAEDGETAEDCALRETFEELAIPPAEVTLLGKPDFLVHQRGFVLQPVIGLVSPAGLAAMTPSPAEVAEVFTAPAEFFRSTAPVLSHYTLEPQVPADFPFDAVGIAPDYPWGAGQVEVPVWRYGGHVIWGLTARILREVFREM